MRAVFSALCALFLLTACDTTTSLKELRHAPVAEDPYQAALATRYQEFAEEKVAAYDWWTSKYFADKGLMAAYSRPVQPEDPAAWDIPATMQPAFAEARSQLIDAVADAASDQPAQAAEAVVAYDRWLELQENGWDEPRIADARDAFFAALGALNPTQTTREAAPVPVETTSTVLYFPFNSTLFTDSARAALDQLIGYLKTAGNVSVTINGHTDRAGADDYNLILSEQRAQLVKDALVAAGIPETILHHFAFGETDPDVATDDGVREPLNRRVEIFLE
jgi:OOP family OmpA-OmpF porin